MTTAHKIEVIITTVAEFYGIDWRKMMANQGYGYMRANVYRLVKGYISASAPHEYLNTTRGTIVECLRRHPETDSFDILHYQIKNQFKAAS